MNADFDFQDVAKMSSSANFYPHSLYFPRMKTPHQQEWEYYVTKLHGADLAATDEDLEALKNLVNKLGR